MINLNFSYKDDKFAERITSPNALIPHIRKFGISVEGYLALRVLESLRTSPENYIESTRQ